MGTTGRVLVLALIVTLSLVGLPLPVHAGGEEPPITLRGRSLNPGPLSELLYARLPEAASPLLEQAKSRINGLLQDADGEPLGDRRVELEPLSEQLTRIEAVERRVHVTTDANGAFSFVGLDPGRYEVRHRVDGDTVASGQIELAAGANQVHNLTLPEENQGLSKGAKILIGVSVAVLVVAVVGGATCLFCDTFGEMGAGEF